MSKLSCFVRYSEDNKVVPLSLVKVPVFPSMPGNWKEVRSVCCDPESDKFLNNSTPLKAFLIINGKGEPMSGPLVRTTRPSGVITMQIQYSACCDINQEITIVTQPQNLTVTEGTPVVFSVVATGAELTYKWQRDGVDISGATTNSYTLSSPTLVDDNGAVFTVVITNGSQTITSNPATLTVNVV